MKHRTAKIRAAAILAVGGAGVWLTGCTQNDVSHADQAFHTVAEGTHVVGDKMANGVKEAGHKINKSAKETAHEINEKAAHHS